MSEPGARIRLWQPADVRGIAELVDVDAGALWRNQFHSLHGGPVDAPGWRQTVVATLDLDPTAIVAAGTAATNRIHPGRYTAAVEVATDFRRRGIGTALVHELLRLRPQSRPLASKIVVSCEAPMSFVERLGGRVYQRCPGVTVDPLSPEVRGWVTDVSPPLGCRVDNLVELSFDELAAAFASQYRWVHQSWSPVGDEATLERVSHQVGADLDLHTSSGVWVDEVLVALALAFADEDDSVDVVVETVERDCPDGVEMVRSAVARTLGIAATAGVTRVEFDGHESDPHLDPVVRSLPPGDFAPVDLVEWP